MTVEKKTSYRFRIYMTLSIIKINSVTNLANSESLSIREVLIFRMCHCFKNLPLK